MRVQHHRPWVERASATWAVSEGGGGRRSYREAILTVRVVGFPESEAPCEGGAVDELLKPRYHGREGRDGGDLRPEGRTIVFHEGEEEVCERWVGAVLAKLGQVMCPEHREASFK